MDTVQAGEKRHFACVLYKLMFRDHISRVHWRDLISNKTILIVLFICSLIFFTWNYSSSSSSSILGISLNKETRSSCSCHADGETQKVLCLHRPQPQTVGWAALSATGAAALHHCQHWHSCERNSKIIWSINLMSSKVMLGANYRQNFLQNSEYNFVFEKIHLNSDSCRIEQ